MTKHLEKRRDQLAEKISHTQGYKHGDSKTKYAFIAGWDLCFKEMAPAIEALRRIARDCSLECDTSGELNCVNLAEEALKGIGIE